MLMRALIVAASLGCSVSLWAEKPAEDLFVLNAASPSELVKGRPALGQAGSFRSLSNVWSGNGPLTLVDGRQFSFPGAFGWVEATPEAFLPAFAAVGLPRVTPGDPLVRSTSDEKFGFLPKPDYVGGEVGFFFGRGSGKNSRDVEAGYFISEIVEGNTHITVGASYEHSSGKSPRIIGR